MGQIQVALETVQPSLLPPAVVETVIRLGLIPSADLFQWSIEIRNATDGQLLALESAVGLHIAQLVSRSHAIRQRAVYLTLEATAPF